MKSLEDIYGHCIIPKNTLLFRGHTDTSFDDCMFFATKEWVAGAFNNQVQIWKATTDIQILFLVEYLDDRSWTMSALPKLYNSVFPSDSNPDFDDLNIKHWDINRRNKLGQKLFDEYKISGWLTSLENRVEMEVCLFDKQANENQLQLLGTENAKGNNFYVDSLARIRIIPSSNFYKQTNQKLSERAPILTDEKDHYKRYERMMNAWIQDEIQNGKCEAEAKHYHFNLRTKLKV